MEPIRALHVVHTMNRGGMESRIMDMYRKLDRCKYQYDFYISSGKKGAFDDEVLSMGGRIFYAVQFNKYNIPSFSAFHRFLLGHSEYRIVYAYNQWAGSYLKQAKKCGVPCRIAYARTSLQKKSVKNTIKNLIKLNVNRYANYRFAVSKKAAIWLFGKRTTESGNVNIWANAINTCNFAFSTEVRDAMRHSLKLEDSYVVMHVGNFTYAKNHFFLFRVFAEVKKMHENAKLVLVGKGDLSAFETAMCNLHIEDEVIHLGVRDDIPKLLQASDAFVFPSLYEGFPGAVLEAEASGVKCLISDSITEEVILTENIRAISLNRQPYEWAEALDEIMDVDRRVAWRIVKDAGYDVNDSVIKQEEFIKTVMN